MELYQLRSFAAIAESGQLTRAAEILHVSQPAVSAQLRALEDELDVLLFERSSTGMVLTAAGRRLLARAEKVLAAAQALLNEARGLKGSLVGTASIGTLSDPEFTRVGGFMSATVARYPLLQIELHQGITGELLERVRDKDLDAAFYYGDLKYPGVAGHALREVVYRVAAPKAWCERLEGADWPAVAALPWIIPPPISTHHQMAHSLLRANDVEPSRIVESDQETVISSLVVSGVGIALMREDVALEKEASGEICIWGDSSVTTTLWFIYPRDRERDPIIRALLDVQRDLWNLRRDAAPPRHRPADAVAE